MNKKNESNAWEKENKKRKWGRQRKKEAITFRKGSEIYPAQDTHKGPYYYISHPPTETQLLRMQ